MLTFWTAVVGVLVGGLVTTAGATWQQRRLWTREDRLRLETQSRQQRQAYRDDLTRRLAGLLSACNKVNSLRSAKDKLVATGNTASMTEQIANFNERVSERWDDVQDAMVVFMFVGDNEVIRYALGRLVKATEAIVEDLYKTNIAGINANVAREFKDARKAAEKQMRDHIRQLDREITSG
jgi:hypothetical protein